MPHSPVLPEILRLDPVVDHQRIVFLSTRYDFPFDTVRSLELALFRTFCVPSIALLLDQTGEFARAAQKRYDDTDLIVSEMMEYGYDSDRGRRALRRMNQIHSRFDIRNEDYLYVLSTFIFEPIRWNARFGWRLFVEAERQALFHFWCQVGRRMNIQDIPGDATTLEALSREYERTRFAHTPEVARVGAATRAMFLSWFPAVLRPLVRPAIHAMLDEPMRRAFGFPPPPPGLRTVLETAMRTRSLLLRAWPRRRKPFLRTEMGHRTYPHGYAIEQLGPVSQAEGPR